MYMAPEIHDVHAYGIASNIRPGELLEKIGLVGVERLGKTHARAKLAAGAVIVAYDFGAFVFFDTPAERRDDLMRSVLAHVGPEPHAPLRDDYRVEVAPDARPAVTFDRAIVHQLDDAAIEIISLVVAQSVTLDYYDEDVDALFRRVGALSALLAEKGKLSGSSRDIQRTVGAILVTRGQIVGSLSLLDAPPQTWEDERLDRLYRAMRGTFEIADRYSTFTDKLSLVQQNLLVIVDLMQHRRAQTIELVVVLLIAVELLVAILGRR
jgi:required for meiotic nuclear division protein 1